MTSPRDRLAQLAEGALPALVYPILTQNPITGETEKSFDALAHAADLKALLSERRVGREALALSASDHACYLFPGEDQVMLRDAFVQGALSLLNGEDHD